MKNNSVRYIPRRKFLEMSMKGGLLIATAPSVLYALNSCSGSGATFPPPGIDPSLLSKVLARALEKGGDFADIYVESRISRQIVMEESIFRGGLYGVSQGAGIRVVSGNKTGYAYTEELTKDKLLRAADIASFVARGGDKASVKPVSVTERPSYVTVKITLQQVADEQRLQILKRADEAARDYDRRIKMTSIEYNDEIRSRIIATSEGVYLQDELPLLFFIVQAMSDDGFSRHMARERLSYHSGFEMFESVTPETVARNAAREAVDMLGAKDAPAGIMDVVMQNGWGGVLVHEAV
mgnify:CR=1 FL=1